MDSDLIRGEADDDCSILCQPKTVVPIEPESVKNSSQFICGLWGRREV